MKKLLIIIACLLLSVVFAGAADDKETLTLKRNLAQERVLRIKAEMSLMQSSFKEAQEAMKVTTQELEALNKSLQALEIKKPQ